jgi:hypothetical protein
LKENAMVSRLLLSLLVLLLLMTSCTENRASLYVQDMKVPTDECFIPGDKDAAYYSWGTWDVGLGYSYQVHPLLVNEMSSSLTLNPNAAETNSVLVKGAWVALLDATDTELIAPVFVYSPCTVEPEGSSTAMNFTAVNAATYDTLAGIFRGTLTGIYDLCHTRTTSTLVIRIRIVGKTTGDRDIDTPYFYFPITVCCGCTVFFPPDAFDSIVGLHDCLGEEGTETEPPCFLGQDKNVDCRQCAGNFPELCAPTSETFDNPWYSI